ncbi:exodeoxyribonuclease VII small subunit [Paenibacillus polymyxa]|uniref:hypothetical protein n=1 Tax=Paenibacillus TaxID=44249 RepID=UPI0006A7200D|nr:MULTISPECIES: hypothetical protein [Paenibacillus]APB74971.2 exodeoxyribonuclease VII small subunit [Paenibacillus polymyxa]
MNTETLYEMLQFKKVVIELKITIPKEMIDSELKKYIEVVEELQQIGQKVLSTVISESQRINKSKPSLFISLVIMKRMLECMSSIKLLVTLRHRRDASILLLNLIELRLDLMYIALDDKHADVWLDHDKEHTKPWKIGFLFRSLYVEEGELNAEKENYKRFSMAKHGNPLGGLMSFPIEVTNRALLINEEQNDSPYSSIIYFFACGVEVYRICNSTLTIAKQLGLDIEQINETLEKTFEVLRKLYDQDTLRTVHELVNSIEKPHLCNVCCAIPKGKVEINCLIRQGSYKRELLFDQNVQFSCEAFIEKP